jgi:hypothetical protein
LFGHVTLLVTSPTSVIVTAPPQLSPALTAAVLAAGTFEAHVTVVAVGHDTVGATLSLTVIVCVQTAVLLQRSVAMYVRVTVYLFGQVTLLVTSPTKLIVTAPPQLSPAVTRPVFAVGTFEAHVTVVAVGQLSVGATLSLTTIVCVQTAVLLQRSVAR